MTHSDYTPNTIQFSFNVNVTSPLIWPEYFGFSSAKAMLTDFLTKEFTPGTLSLIEVTGSNAQCTIVFATSLSSFEVAKDYKRAVTLLERLSAYPSFNTEPTHIAKMITELEQANVKVNDNFPTEVLYARYNENRFGFATYQQKMLDIASKRAQSA